MRKRERGRGREREKETQKMEEDFELPALARRGAGGRRKGAGVRKSGYGKVVGPTTAAGTATL